MKGKKIFKVILDVLVWIIIILAASVTLITLTSREKGVSQVFGYVPLNIQTGSMEPTIMTDDLIITNNMMVRVNLKREMLSHLEQQNKILISLKHTVLSLF